MSKTLEAMSRGLLVLLALAALPAAAEPWVEGTQIEPIPLKDQHGKARAIDAGVRAILFARDMDGGDILKRALAESGAERLLRAHAVYVADVSRMPGLIRRLFAMPSLRRRGYPILLDEEGSVTRDFPGEEGRATLIDLRSLRVVRIRHLDDPEALRAALEPEPPSEERTPAP